MGRSLCHLPSCIPHQPHSVSLFIQQFLRTFTACGFQLLLFRLSRTPWWEAVVNTVMSAGPSSPGAAFLSRGWAVLQGARSLGGSFPDSSCRLGGSTWLKPGDQCPSQVLLPGLGPCPCWHYRPPFGLNISDFSSTTQARQSSVQEALALRDMFSILLTSFLWSPAYLPLSSSRFRAGVLVLFFHNKYSVHSWSISTKGVMGRSPAELCLLFAWVVLARADSVSLTLLCCASPFISSRGCTTPGRLPSVGRSLLTWLSRNHFLAALSLHSEPGWSLWSQWPPCISGLTGQVGSAHDPTLDLPLRLWVGRARFPARMAVGR